MPCSQAGNRSHPGTYTTGRPCSSADTIAAATRAAGMGAGLARPYGVPRRLKNGVSITPGTITLTVTPRPRIS